jgi:DUF1009 family protein
MPLCVFIGQGPVGQHVAARLRDVAPDAKVIGLRDARHWLVRQFHDARYVSSLQFGKCLEALHTVGASEVIFAVEAYGSFFPTTIDPLAVKYLFQRGNFWLPYSYLEAFQKFLGDHGIALRSVLDYFPELSAEVGFEAGAHNGYQGDADLAAAGDHAKHQPLRKNSRVLIVGGGKVLMFQPGRGRTNDLIKAFGSSSVRKEVPYPVLCKISLIPSDQIDVPTIGEDTVRLCIANGIRAIVLEGGKNILMQREEVIRLANEGSIYVCAR